MMGALLTISWLSITVVNVGGYEAIKAEHGMLKVPVETMEVCYKAGKQATDLIAKTIPAVDYECSPSV
ncbi:hypothetical protein N9043_00170 [bacterium]|nr:hypothetical protein [bacterium]